MLLAATGLAREVLVMERDRGAHDTIRVLDDDPALWGTELDGVPVVGGLDLVGEYADHELLVCAGRGTSRRAIVERLADLGVGAGRYATVVHPRVHLPDGCRIGRGSIVLEGVVMTAAVDVGEHVVAMPHVTLTHDDVVEDFVTLCAGVNLGGRVRVRTGAYLGMGSCVREDVVVGEDAVLGMGAALTTGLPAGETWVGVPARRISIAVEVER